MKIQKCVLIDMNLKSCVNGMLLLYCHFRKYDVHYFGGPSIWFLTIITVSGGGGSERAAHKMCVCKERMYVNVAIFYYIQ